MLKAAPAIQTKVVWAGVYGGHYDIIVFFSQKPKRSSLKELQKSYFITPGNYPKGYYDCLLNEKLIIGDMGLETFQLVFNVDLSSRLINNRPPDTEIVEVFQIELTAIFDECGNLPHLHVDWK